MDTPLKEGIAGPMPVSRWMRLRMFRRTLDNPVFQSLNSRYYRPATKGAKRGFVLGLLIALAHFLLILLFTEPNGKPFGDAARAFGYGFIIVTLVLATTVFVFIRALLAVVFGAVQRVQRDIESTGMRSLMSSPLTDDEILSGYARFASYKALKANEAAVAFLLTLGLAGSVLILFIPEFLPLWEEPIGLLVPLGFIVAAFILLASLVLYTSTGAYAGTMYALRFDFVYATVAAFAHVIIVWLLSALTFFLIILPLIFLTRLTGRLAVRMFGRWRRPGIVGSSE